MQLQSSTKEGYWLQSSLVHPHDEDQEDAWSQNPTMQDRKSTRLNSSHRP